MRSRKKVLVIVGTRPEAIKVAPVVLLARQDYQDQIDLNVGATGQHEKLFRQSLSAFDITPVFNLDIMREGTDLAFITREMLGGLNDWLDANKPDVVLVHGDTTTTFSAALACFYRNIPVGHIEAGLRTHDLTNPFPEEFNRQTVSKIASLHFAPTEMARQNLLAERVKDESILVTGNTVIDALDITLDRIAKNPTRRTEIESALRAALPVDFQNLPLVLVTTHRRESQGSGIRNIFRAIEYLSQTYPAFHFVLPVHPNPAISLVASEMLGSLGNVHLIEALGYEEFTLLLSHSQIVVTDSGGLQEEAPRLGIPVLVTRNTTERPEGVLAGTSRLVGTSVEKILAGFESVADNLAKKPFPNLEHRQLFGDGQASQRILKRLLESW